MERRVTTRDAVPPAPRGDGREWPLVPFLEGSELALSSIRLEPGGSCAVGDDLRHAIVFVFDGAGETDAGPLRTGTALLLRDGEHASLEAGADGLDAVCGTIGPGVDLHAPLGPTAPLAQLESSERSRATGARSFQVLFDAANGSTRATAFVGHIPPGQAPRHYHLYDEIVWVLSGEGRLHLTRTPERLAPGSAFRLRPRETHIVENTSEEGPLSVLGLFTPAGSPSAAYLEPAVYATYAPGPG